VLRRTIIAACVLLFLVLVLAALWSGFDWPPPRLILKYGFPPTGGPTGRTMTIEGVEFVELKPGYFRMGSHFLCQKGDLLGRVCAVLGIRWGMQPKHAGNECPPHWVEIARVFWIARTEVTNEQYERFDPSHGREMYSCEAKGPVLYVTRDEAINYCMWLGTVSDLSVKLPTEAEWEYACRGGGQGEYCFGDEEAGLGDYGWFSGNAVCRARPVSMLNSNAFGLVDMHGNASEWCEDAYRPKNCPVMSATLSSASDGRCGDPRIGVLRGGCADSPAIGCRSAVRTPWPPELSVVFVGFRPVLAAR
jgi:eukaryotic-like serine/threonine-protein kinase